MNIKSENMTSADNQQETLAFSEGLLRDYTPSSYTQISRAYLKGMLHDATERRYTYRISQNSASFVDYLSKGIQALGYKAWTYKEGRAREVYVVEFSKRILQGYKLSSSQQRIDYIRGYFDSEGSVPRVKSVKFYIYFAQKDLADLEEVKLFLEQLGIQCGKTHNPSIKVDPDYFRFYVSMKSHQKFARIVGSWHPIKSRMLRMKI